MKTILSVHWALIASMWYFGNGTLHSATVLMRHKGKYDKGIIKIIDGRAGFNVVGSSSIDVLADDVK